MNQFDSRWKIAAAAAHRAADEPPAAAPLGFATRVVAHWRAAPAPSLAALWQQLAWRVLGGVAAALMAMIAIDAAASTQDDPLTADVGDTVSELFWLQQ
jgi:hypothetical protein